MPGSSSAASSPTRRSCASLANALISETASASIPASRSRRSWARAASSSSSRTTEPSLAIRPGTSTVFSRAASGSGFGQMIQPASPPGTNDRAIWSTCRKPSVVTSPTVAPLPSRIALVATVVPCRTCAMAARSTPACSRDLVDAVQHPDGLVVRRGRRLGPPGGPGALVDQQHVGEGAADVDPEAIAHFPALLRWLSQMTAAARSRASSAASSPTRLAPDLVVVLPQGRPGRPDGSGGGGQLRGDVLHGDLAEVRVRDRDDGVPRREVRVGEHVPGPEDAPGGHAGLVQAAEQVVGGRAWRSRPR